MLSIVVQVVISPPSKEEVADLFKEAEEVSSILEAEEKLVLKEVGMIMIVAGVEIPEVIKEVEVMVEFNLLVKGFLEIQGEVICRILSVIIMADMDICNHIVGLSCLRVMDVLIQLDLRL